MDRLSTLPGNCKSLTDAVRVIDIDGQQLPPRTLAEAQAYAAEHRAELIYLDTERYVALFGLVDAAWLSRLRAGHDNAA